MTSLDKLKELQLISTKKEREKYLLDNMDDKIFTDIIRFLLNDEITTGISGTKWNNSDYNYYDYCKGYPGGISEMLDFITINNTGKMKLVSYIKYMSQGRYEDIFKGIFTKTLKLGFTKKTWNSLCPADLKVPESPYMGCKPYKESLINKLFQENDYVYSDIKEDGQFLNMHILEDEIKFTSRKGFPQELLICDIVLNCIKIKEEFYDNVITGELMIKEISDRTIANGIIRSFIDINAKIVESEDNEDEIHKLTESFKKKYKFSHTEMCERLYIKVWDIIPKKDFDNGLCLIPYNERLANLDRLFSWYDFSHIIMSKRKIVKTKQEALEHFKEALANGEEGTILKSPYATFKDGKHDSQVKMKLVMNVELRITGYKLGESTGKYANTVGTLMCESDDAICSTGVNGLSSALRDEIKHNFHNYEGKIITAKCNGTSEDKHGNKSLMYANFLEFRDDKTEANTWNEILEIEQSALNLKSDMEDDINGIQ